MQEENKEAITLNMVDVMSMLNLIEYNGLKDKMSPVSWERVNKEVDKIIQQYPQP